MTAPVVAPISTGSDEDDPPHINCAHVDRTWCGLASAGMELVAAPSQIHEVCRMCVLALELWDPAGNCPVCGCERCLT